MHLFCVDCRAFTLGKQRCARCLERHFTSRMAAPLAATAGGHGVEVRNTTRLEVDIGGQKRQLQTDGPATEADVRRMLADMNLPESELQKIISALLR